MKLLLLSALFVTALTHPLDDTDGDTEWELFKIAHVKDYKSQEEELMRKKIFLDNLKFVHDHNTKYKRGEVTFNVAINKFADLTTEEFGKIYNGIRRIPEDYQRSGKEFDLPEDLELPKAVDWRKKGAVTPVKDQGKCGSDWAFSATGSLEGLTFLKTKKLVSLSEQNLVDCSTEEGNDGCNSGITIFAFQYVADNKGIDTEASYPYEGVDGKCRYKKSNKGAEDTGYTFIRSDSEPDLQYAIAKIGPVSVLMNAGLKSFQLYKSGIYKDPSCSPDFVNHGVLAVGYGALKKGGQYYIVKNSWGTDWGMKGYFLLARNDNNMCGVAELASYPNV